MKKTETKIEIDEKARSCRKKLWITVSSFFGEGQDCNSV